MAQPTVSQAAGKLYTDPPRVAVTTKMLDTWAIDFANSLNPGEAIDSVAATLVRLQPAPDAAVADFVTDTAVDGTDAVIGWTGEVLESGGLYRLEVTATLTTGATVDRLLFVECAA
jgi:hypothetical protein